MSMHLMAILAKMQAKLADFETRLAAVESEKQPDEKIVTFPITESVDKRKPGRPRNAG
jgi:hypothetical protein